MEEEFAGSTWTFGDTTVSLLPDGERWLLEQRNSRTGEHSDVAYTDIGVAVANFSDAAAEAALRYARAGTQVYAYTGQYFGPDHCGAVVLPCGDGVLVAWNLPTGSSVEGRDWWEHEDDHELGVQLCQSVHKALSKYADLLNQIFVPPRHGHDLPLANIASRSLRNLAAEAYLDALLVQYADRLQEYYSQLNQHERMLAHSALRVLLGLPPERIAQAGALYSSRQPR